LINEEVAAQRDLLTTVLEANMAVISVEQNALGVRQNATIERLTILATIFLPLTFVTGFFGQNFAWMIDRPQTLEAFAVFGIGGLLAPLLLLYLWLRSNTRRDATERSAHVPPVVPPRPGHLDIHGGHRIPVGG
jgi:magnesium transporter